MRKEKENNGAISDNLLSSLHSVFQQPLLGALDLIDQGSVTKLTCPAGRTLYQVRGTTGASYYCFTSSNYCSCPSFIFTVLKKEDALYCKHAIAALIGEALRRVVDKQISNDEFSRLLSDLFKGTAHTP